MAVDLKINKKLEPLCRRHKPFKVIVGGRGSGKSIGVADIMVGLKMFAENASVLCLREFQDSVSDSVHAVMSESVLKRLDLRNWEIQKNTIITPPRLDGQPRARTLYRGAMRNPQALRSIHGFKYSWFEEAQTASQTSLDDLIPTIQRTTGAECWFVANPMASEDPFSKRFIVPFKAILDRDGFYEDDLHMIVVVNHKDNPWWNEASELVRAHDFKTMSRAKYYHIWEGAFNDEVEDSIILAEWFDAAIDAHLKKPEAFKPTGAIIAAHDPFDDGGDEAGFAVRHGSIMKQVRARGHGLIDEVCDWATDLATQADADWFVWDGDGMGTGLRRQVSDAFEGKITKFHMFKGSLSGSGQDHAKQIYDPVEGEDKPKDYENTFLNNRAQYYTALAQRFKKTYLAIDKGKYIDPAEMISLASEGIDDITSLRSELCRIPSRPNGRGLIQIMSKKEMKKLGIASPNKADAIMMTMFMPPATDDSIEIDYEGG